MEKNLKSDEKKQSDTTVKKVPYFYAIGRRKSSIAQARIYQSEKLDGQIHVNDRKMEEYFTVERMKKALAEPLSSTGNLGNFDVKVKVKGGGINAQADAIRLAIARALVVFDENLKKPLSDLGLMKRDSRKVERKKPGLKKARRSPQWAKR
jgi:small subunit ribosomal protein S9